jgi:hypothetical protein
MDMRRLIFAALAVLIAVPAQAQTATLRLATAAPDGSYWMREMRAGADEIARHTDGRVRIQYFPGGVMGNDQAVLRRMRIGQLQGGAFTGGALMQVHGDAGIYSLPFLFRSHDEVDYVRERMDARIERGLEQAGLVSFGIAEGGFANLMSGVPVARVEDLRGQKVWVPEGDPVAAAAAGARGRAPRPPPAGGGPRAAGRPPGRPRPPAPPRRRAAAGGGAARRPGRVSLSSTVCSSASPTSRGRPGTSSTQVEAVRSRTTVVAPVAGSTCRGTSRRSRTSPVLPGVPDPSRSWPCRARQSRTRRSSVRRTRSSAKASGSVICRWRRSVTACTAGSRSKIGSSTVSHTAASGSGTVRPRSGLRWDGRRGSASMRCPVRSLNPARAAATRWL